MIYLKLLATFSLLGSLIWFFSEPGFEPALAAVGSMSAIIGLFVSDKKKRGESNQTQTISRNSFGIQAGGDVNINKLERKKDV